MCYLWLLYTSERIPKTRIVSEMMFLFWSAVSPPFENTTSYQIPYVRAYDELTLPWEYYVKFYPILHMWVTDLNHWTSSASEVRGLPDTDGKAAPCQLFLKMENMHCDRLHSGISFVQNTQLRHRALRFPTPEAERPTCTTDLMLPQISKIVRLAPPKNTATQSHLKHLVAFYLKPHLLFYGH